MTIHLPSPGKPLRSGDLEFTMRETNGRSPTHPPKYSIIHQSNTGRVAAQYGEFSGSVPPIVQATLMQGGRKPYCHQAEAAQRILDDGMNVAIVTSTASGKTFAFLAAVLSILQQDPTATSMMVYPTNALVSDQMKVLVKMGFIEVETGLYELSLGVTVICAAILNGETTPATRKRIRSKANLLITNHAALHESLLAQCTRKYKDGTSWHRYLAGLKIVVFDEGHSYNGVDGTHAALTFRRLLLIVKKLSGKSPQVMMASATIGNPLEHAASLTGLVNWALVNRSGAASFPREIQILLPDGHPSGKGRWAASIVVAEIAIAEAERGRKVLVFCPSRNDTGKLSDRINAKIMRKAAVAFHAAIPVEEKRVTLKQILDGKVEIVCATSALELGVDIGGVDTVILMGHPGDHASFNQRAGRVGRTSPGKVLLVLDENHHPMNVYLQGNPDALFWEPESRTIYPSNPIVAIRHAACAVLETQDPVLVETAFPGLDEKKLQAAVLGIPHKGIAMFGMGNFGQFKALDPNGKVLQELGGEVALFNWHLRATIRNQIGEFFRVREVNVQRQTVLTSRLDSEPGPNGMRIYTTPRIETEKYPLPETVVPILGIPDVIDPIEGQFDVHRMTVGYTESQEGDPTKVHDQVQVHLLDPEERNPPIGFITRGVQFGLALEHPLAIAMVEDVGGIQAVQDAMGLSLSLIVQARAKDVPIEITLEEDRILFFAFDMAEGGMGWSEQLVRALNRWWIAAGKALLKCSCLMKGCPRCSLSSTKGDDRRRLANALIKAGTK